MAEKMKRRHLGLLAFFLMVVIGSAFVIMKSSEVRASSGNTLYVGGSESGNYSSIQDAIGSAVLGDTIYVYNGTYQENVVIDKEIRLTGENQNTTIIDGGGHNDTVYISASNVIVENFTITHSATQQAGIDLEKSYTYDKTEHCIIKYCNIINNYYGIDAASSGGEVYHTFRDNNISNNYEDGIHLCSSNNIIKNNTITHNKDRGLYLFGSDENTISYNIITHNEGDWHAGGIYLEHSSNNEITYNIVAYNMPEGFYLTASSASIHHNNIANNGVNAKDDYYNFWDDGSKGNYWGDYNGNDNDEDGIGESPYYISGEGQAQDRYPLIRPVEDAPQQPNNPPNIPSKPSGQSSGYTGTSYSYATSATDSDGDQVKYYFDWDDGTETWTSLQDSGQTASKSHTWSNTGTYQVRVKAQDEHGAESDWSTIKSVTITTYTPPPPNESPTCSLSASPTAGYAPLEVTLSLSASDTDGSIESWKLDIDNDGSADYSGSGSPPTTKLHTYQDVGEYTAKLTVTDNDGATDTDTTTITVNEVPNQAPTANFDYSPSNPTANTTVNFTDSSTDTDGNIANCTWSFGDETTGYGQTINHTYTAPGTYNVTLTVTDDDGDTDIYIKSVEIKAPSKDEDGTPGFGIALLVMAIAAMLLIKRHKIKK